MGSQFMGWKLQVPQRGALGRQVGEETGAVFMSMLLA